MAKRKRLGMPDFAAGDAPTGARETKSMVSAPATAPDPAPHSGRPQSRAPIADVAGQAALSDALTRVSDELTSARAEGRMVLKIPLDAIDVSHIMRDRGHLDPAELEILKTSIRARGQQTPIEVVALQDGRYGLISGWRRMRALRDLAQDGQGDDRQGTGHVLALLRDPDTASDAYTAMIEENEIRVGLSYFERASIVERVVVAGVFADTASALNTLFASGSRAKRSKIKSFLSLVETLGAHCRFPQAISERLGLALVGRMASDPDFTLRLKDRLRKADPQDAASETALLEKALGAPSPASAKTVSPKPVQKVTLTSVTGPNSSISVNHSDGRIIIEGAGISDALALKIKRVVRDWRE